MTAYLGIPRLARISTARNGVPHITPVWYLHDGGNFFVSTGTKTRTAGDIKKNPNVSLTIDSSDGMFRHKCVIVNGVAQLSREGHPEVTRRIYERYLGRKGLKHPFAKQLLDDDQYVLTIIPQKILTWDYTKLIQS